MAQFLSFENAMEYDPYSVELQTGLRLGQVPGSATSPGTMPGIGRSAGPHGMPIDGPRAAVSLSNPLTWFGLFAAVTFGLIAASTQVRVGKATVRVSAGKEK